MTVRLSEVDAILLANGRKLIEWLEPFKYFSQKSVLVTDNSKKRFSIHIFTADHIYRIITTPPRDEDDLGYLGCTVSTRRSRPGEEWNRGNDLPDGRCSKETLISILGAILFYEAKDVVVPRGPRVVPENKE